MTAKRQPDPFADLEAVDVTTTGPASRDGVQDAPTPAKDSAGVRTRHEARVWAFDQVKSGSRGWLGMCLMFVRSCFGVDPLEPDAKAAWLAATHKHRTDDPAKVPNAKPVFWQVGENWHVAFSIGDGRCVSTDVRRAGQANVCHIQAISDAWSATLLGYTDDLNGEFPVPATKRRPRVNDRAWRVRMLRASIERARHDGNSPRVMRLRRWLREVRNVR